jgi:hypothetical protein
LPGGIYGKVLIKEGRREQFIMHPQAQRAVERMRAAGFQYPQEFTVSTIRYRRKADRAEHGDYGRALITFRHFSPERIIARREAMQAQGLSIQCSTRRGIPAWVEVFSDGEGTYRELSLDEPEQHL